MSRRNFIKQGSMLAGGFMLHHPLAKAIGREEKITVGIIGCGDRGKGLMTILNQLPGIFEITAICDVLDFRFAEAKKVYNSARLKEYKDHRQLLADKSIKAVIIAVPLYLHFSIARDALGAGKHVYLEKTMTYNIPQALELVQEAGKHPKQILQIGHQYRYTPLYYRVKDMIEKDYLGKVSQIECRWDRNNNWRRPVPDPSLERRINWRMYREYSGGMPAELLSHQIDFIQWAFNCRPDTILASGGIDVYKDGRETFDNVQATIRYEKQGMIGSFGATQGNQHEGYSFKIKGTKGMVSLLVDEGIFYPEPDTRKELQTIDGVAGATKIEWKNDGGIPILKEKTKDGSWYALQDFYKSITQQRTPDSNVKTGATTAISVAMINASLFEKNIQTWKNNYTIT
ncbi:MAG: Gfo/Idh/MocA family oxidoreductase [Mucilaginibacter polytrichastri]|nr:Gfo/Idh/MocA family oxidoreductase [Mucilaginibacter polytrichastri]